MDVFTVAMLARSPFSAWSVGLSMVIVAAIVGPVLRWVADRPKVRRLLTGLGFAVLAAVGLSVVISCVGACLDCVNAGYPVWFCWYVYGSGF